MARLRVEVPGEIPANAADVYNLLADYREGHPRILPPEHFRDLVVEEGGRGEGTVFRIVTVAGGVEKPYRMAVSEPEPGRVLAEQDMDSSLLTTFVVDPLGADRARLTIATEWDASRGLAGLFERFAYPPAMRSIYRKEIRRIADFLRERRSGGAATS